MIARLFHNDGLELDVSVERTENLPPATVVRHNGRYFSLTTLNQNLWPDKIFTYHEATFWDLNS